jgi:hypothetical protein
MVSGMPNGVGGWKTLVLWRWDSWHEIDLKFRRVPGLNATQSSMQGH